MVTRESEASAPPLRYAIPLRSGTGPDRPWSGRSSLLFRDSPLFRLSPTTLRVFLPSLQYRGKYCQTDPLPDFYTQ